MAVSNAAYLAKSLLAHKVVEYNSHCRERSYLYMTWPSNGDTGSIPCLETASGKARMSQPRLGTSFLANFLQYMLLGLTSLPCLTSAYKGLVGRSPVDANIGVHSGSLDVEQLYDLVCRVAENMDTPALSRTSTSLWGEVPSYTGDAEQMEEYLTDELTKYACFSAMTFCQTKPCNPGALQLIKPCMCAGVLKPGV